MQKVVWDNGGRRGGPGSATAGGGEDTVPGKESGAPLDPTADGVRKGAVTSICTPYGLSNRNSR